MTGSKTAPTEVEYDPTTDTYYGKFDPETVDPTTAVANHLAEVKHCDPIELSPIYDTVDTDGLDSVLRPAAADATVTVTFPHDGFEITVGSDGGIEISPPEPGQR